MHKGFYHLWNIKKSKGENFQTGFYTKNITKWSAMAVKRILVNEVYTGNLVQGKE